MQYLGGKSRIAKELCLFLNNQLQEKQPFVDLFCGSCNIISKIEPNRTRIANDISKPVIALYEYACEGGQLPDDITYEQYKDVLNHKNTDKYPDWYKGFVGFGCSFAGKYFGGYARQENVNYARLTKRSILRKIETMKNVTFYNVSYDCVDIPNNSLVYCDIPYFNTTRYSSGKFDHNMFYDFARQLKENGCSVFISEYQENTPNDFEIVYTLPSRKKMRDKNNSAVITAEVLISPK